MPKPIRRSMSAAATRRTSSRCCRASPSARRRISMNMLVEGIEHITLDDIGFAREFGYRIKLLGVARRIGNGIDQRVQPAMVRLGTPLADVDGAFNAVVADAGAAGPFIFEGRGAGEGPTSSAVIADLVDIALGSFEPAFGKPAHRLAQLNPAPAEAASSAYYLRFEVLDVPGRARRDRRPSGGVPRFDRKHAPARPQPGRAGVDRHDHPRNLTGFGGTRLEGDCRLRQGARPAYNDSHGSELKFRKRRDPPIQVIPRPRLRAGSRARHRSRRHCGRAPDRARRRACRRPGRGRGDAHRVQHRCRSTARS